MKKVLLLIVGAGFLLIGLQARAQVLLATTNQGELVELDIANGTATLIGDAGRLAGKDEDAGWTGLSFDGSGNLLVVSRQSTEPDTGCAGSPANTDLRCSHLYRIDPGTGAVLAEIGNTEMPFVSDIDFGPGGVLYGNQWDGRGTLVTVNPTLGTATAVDFFGSKINSIGTAVDLQNGGLSVHPVTGELWAVESNFGTSDDGMPSIFKVDAATGAVIAPEIPLGLSGSPLDFGFDSLEILPDGRFIGIRAGGRNDVYEINPVADAISGLAEITLIPVAVDPELAGSLNGLEFLQASPDQVQAMIDDINALGLDRRTTRRLVSDLEFVRNRLDRGLLDDAREGVCLFIDELERSVSRNRIDPGDANVLLREATNILGQITF